MDFRIVFTNFDFYPIIPTLKNDFSYLFCKSYLFSVVILSHFFNLIIPKLSLFME